MNHKVERAALAIRKGYATPKDEVNEPNLMVTAAMVARGLMDKHGKITLFGDDLSALSAGGDATIVTSGAFVATFTFSNTTAVTFPTSGTLGTLAGTETLTNKTLTSAKVTTKLSPTTDDGAPLGDTTHSFSDLFLASGAVVNYANGDVLLTHSSGVLTLGTGDLRITTAGTNAASAVTVGGTQTLTNKTLTSPTINGALGAKLAQKVIATPVAAAGSSASDAAALGSANILEISSDSAAKGVKLVTGVAGDVVHIINTSSTAAILYPATGGTINGLSANAGVLIPASKGTKAICGAVDTWITYDLAAKSTAA